MPKLPKDGSVEAEYADGYIHSETELDDISPYGPKNIFDDILHKRPEEAHGALVRFTLFYQNARYDLDWTQLPEGARPIRFKNMEQDYNGPLAGVSRIVGVGFGYQFNDETGQNHQEVMEL